MKVIFIYHSSFAVELEESVLVFDYYGKGKLPEIAEKKKVYFFNSHKHPDHFSHEILKLRERYQNAEYILSSDIWIRPEERQSWIYQIKPNKEISIGEKIQIRTLKSTDVGVAFCVKAEGKNIYHAGDLNWWHWEGEDKSWNHNMAAMYCRVIDSIEGQAFDIAFIPLDPRLGKAYFWGMKYFLEHVKVHMVFPMHVWEDYTICQRVKKQPEMQGLLEHFQEISYTGQEWNL